MQTKVPSFSKPKLQFQVMIGVIPINHSFIFSLKMMVWEVVIKIKTSKPRCGVELGQFKTLNMVSLLYKEQKVTRK